MEIFAVFDVGQEAGVDISHLGQLIEGELTLLSICPDSGSKAGAQFLFHICPSGILLLMARRQNICKDNITKLTAGQYSGTVGRGSWWGGGLWHGGLPEGLERYLG